MTDEIVLFLNFIAIHDRMEDLSGYNILLKEPFYINRFIQLWKGKLLIPSSQHQT